MHRHLNGGFCFPKDLWLQYIQEELGPLGQPENCSKIHWRAMKFLEGESVERFISKYTMLQTGHWPLQQTRRRFTSWGSSTALPVGPGGDERLLLQFLVILLPILHLQLFLLNWPSTDVEKSLTLRTSSWIHFHLLAFCPEDKRCCCCTDIKTIFHRVCSSLSQVAWF